MAKATVVIEFIDDEEGVGVRVMSPELNGRTVAADGLTDAENLALALLEDILHDLGIEDMLSVTTHIAH